MYRYHKENYYDDALGFTEHLKGHHSEVQKPMERPTYWQVTNISFTIGKTKRCLIMILCGNVDSPERLHCFEIYFEIYFESYGPGEGILKFPQSCRSLCIRGEDGGGTSV